MARFRKQFGGKFYASLLCAVCIGLFVVQNATALTRGYRTEDRGLRTGMIVSLRQNNNTEEPIVERARPSAVDRVVGVTTTPSDDLLTVANSESQVYVQTSGEAEVYVNDLNGDVDSGDALTLSAVTGTLQRATPDSTVFAVALEDFDKGQAEQSQIQGPSGDMQMVSLQKIRANIDRAGDGGGTKGVDSPLERLGYAIVGREVGEIRVAASLVIFLLVMVTEGGIIYGAISSAITSIGRNPMAQKLIRHEMIRVLAVAIAVLGVGLGAIYAILWI